MRRQASLSTQKNQPPPFLTEHNNSVATEIIELGLKLGMNFNGPLSELHDQIVSILARQQHDWRTDQ